MVMRSASSIQSPMDCEYLKWSYFGWGCWLTETRDHKIEECPRMNGELKCFDTARKAMRRTEKPNRRGYGNRNRLASYL